MDKTQRLLRLSMLALLALATVGAAFATGTGEEEVAELTMYLIGEPHPDTDEMLAELNGYMAEDIGATLTVTYLPWGDWRTRYPLLFASGEEFDLIYTSDWAFYFREAYAGAFLDLTDMLPTVTPDLWEIIPEPAWQQAEIDGSIYMVPANSPEFDGYGFVYRKDLAREYGLDPEIDSMAELGAFMAQVKANEPEMIPYNAGTWDLRLIELIFTGLKDQVHLPIISEDWNIFVTADDLDGEIRVDEYDPAFRDYLMTIRDWQEQGFWSRNVMSNQIGSRDAFEAGTSAVALTNSQNNNSLWSKVSTRNPDWELGYFDVYAGKPNRLIFAYISNGMGINYNSANPELALQLLEKLHTDERYYNLTQFGIEDKHFVFTNDGLRDIPATLDPADSWSFTSWGWGEAGMHPASANDWPLWVEQNLEYAEISMLNPIGDYTFDESGIEAESAAVASVMDQYKTPLYWGLVSDVDAGLAELREKLEQAGYLRIIEEATRQYREFRASGE